MHRCLPDSKSGPLASTYWKATLTPFSFSHLRVECDRKGSGSCRSWAKPKHSHRGLGRYYKQRDQRNRKSRWPKMCPKLRKAEMDLVPGIWRKGQHNEYNRECWGKVTVWIQDPELPLRSESMCTVGGDVRTCQHQGGGH